MAERRHQLTHGNARCPGAAADVVGVAIKAPKRSAAAVAAEVLSFLILRPGSLLPGYMMCAYIDRGNETMQKQAPITRQK